MTHILIMVIIAPLAAAVAGSIAVYWSERLLRCVVAASAFAHAVFVTSIIVYVGDEGSMLYEVGAWVAPVGIMLYADALSVVILLILSAAHVVLVLHTFSAARASRGATWILVELLVAALSGIVVSGDLFNMFVFLELATVASIGLVAHKRSATGAGAGFVYLLFALVSGLLFMIAVVLVYRATGVLSLSGIAAEIDRSPEQAVRVVAGLLLGSLGIKFGLVPFHFWQAPAYEAAGSSAAALMSGAGMKVYLYVLIRLIFHTLRVPVIVPRIGVVLLALGATSILFGHLLALAQRDLKRLLAFSSVAHVGYIFLALAAVSRGGSIGAAAAYGAILHICFHALMKSTLFYSGRSMIVRARASATERMRGVGRAEPLGFAAFMLAAVALVGIPPTSGFYSKWRIALDSFAGYGAFPVVVIAAGTVISMLYYARVLHLGLAEGERPPVTGAERTPTAALALVALLSLGTFSMGVAGPAIEAMLTGAAAVLADPEAILAVTTGGAA